MLVAAQIARKVVASDAADPAVAAVGCVKDGLYLLLQQMKWEHLNLPATEGTAGWRSVATESWEASYCCCCTTGVDGSVQLIIIQSAIRAKIHCPKAVFLS